MAEAGVAFYIGEKQRRFCHLQDDNWWGRDSHPRSSDGIVRHGECRVRNYRGRSYSDSRADGGCAD